MDMILELGLVFILIFILIALFAILIFVYIKMSAFIPYVIAKFMKKDILVVFMKNGAVKLLPATYGSGVYKVDDAKYNWTFIKKDNSMVRFGDRPAALAIDRWGITVNPYLVLTIQELHKLGIMNYEMLGKTLEAEKQVMAEIYTKNQMEGRETTMQDFKNKGIILTQQRLFCNGFDIINFDLISDFTSGMTPSGVTAQIGEEIAKRIKKFKDSNRVEGKGEGLNITMLIVIVGLLLVGLAVLHSQGLI